MSCMRCCSSVGGVTPGDVMRRSAVELWAFMHPREEPWREDAPEEHGIHVKMRRRECDAIEWCRRASDLLLRIRVHAHTCECLATVYELGSFGGRYLIRRTTRGPERPTVHETSLMSARSAGELWSRLLRGLAR